MRQSNVGYFGAQQSVFCELVVTQSCSDGDRTRVRTSKLGFILCEASDVRQGGRFLMIRPAQFTSAFMQVLRSLDERQRHVPWRDSTGTRLLSCYLRDNARLFFFTMIGALPESLNDNISSCRLSERMRRIAIAAPVHETILDAAPLPEADTPVQTTASPAIPAPSTTHVLAPEQPGEVLLVPVATAGQQAEGAV